MSDEIPIPNPPLSGDEVAAFAELSQSAKDAIDVKRYPQFSDVFYGERVRALAGQGRLESQGELSCPRFSEVRLPDEN